MVIKQRLKFNAKYDIMKISMYERAGECFEKRCEYPFIIDAVKYWRC